MKIPRYDSQQNLKVDSPNVEVDTRVAGQAGAGLQEAGKGLMGLSKQFADLRNQTELNEIKLNLANGIDQLEKEALDNPDPYKAMDELHAKALKLKGSLSEGITSPALKADYDLEAQLHLQTKLSSINNMLRKRQIGKSTAVLMQLNDKHEQDFYNAQTDAEKSIAKAMIKSNVDKMVSIGGMNAEEGYKYLRNKESDMRSGVVEHDMVIDAQTTANRLEQGYYKDLTNDERNKLTIKARIEANKQETENNKKAIYNRLAVINNIVGGKIDINDKLIDLAVNDHKLAEALSAAIKRPGKYRPEDDKLIDYQKIAKKVFESKSAEEISNYLLNTLKDYGAEMSKDRLAILIDAAVSRSKNIKATDKQPKVTTSSEQNDIDDGVRRILMHPNGNFDIQSMVNDYLVAVKGGKKPTEAADEVIFNETVRWNPNRKRYQLEQVIPDPVTGKSYRVIGFDPVDGEPLVDEVK